VPAGLANRRFASGGPGHKFSIFAQMNEDNEWLDAPLRAFRLWQETDATGATRRPFAARSILQHATMFERFVRHLSKAGVSVVTFGPAHLDTFLGELAARCAPGTSTRLRYAKLLDRLCRHLVEIDVRADNPAAAFARHTVWPVDEPTPLFLHEANDRRLQDLVGVQPSTDARAIRNAAIVAMLLATGVTSAEIRRVRRGDIRTGGTRPHLVVLAHGARAERVVTMAHFALAPVDAWMTSTSDDDHELLFPLQATTGSFCEETLWRAVHEALDEIGFNGADRSPRVLRNTFARRQLLAGRSNADVSRLLGLSSSRTAVRLRATIDTAPLKA
jgi:site-specific recombinase XerD